MSSKMYLMPSVGERFCPVGELEKGVAAAGGWVLGQFGRDAGFETVRLVWRWAGL